MILYSRRKKPKCKRLQYDSEGRMFDLGKKNNLHNQLRIIIAMNETHKQIQEAFEELYALTIPDKIKFLEVLLFYFTIAGRGIWSDDKPSDPEKIEAFKWLNELSHRIWNIQFQLQRNEGNDSITQLYENMKFYAEQSDLLRSHLVSITISAFKNFKARK